MSKPKQIILEIEWKIALLECTSFLNYLIVLSKYLNIKKTIMSKVDPELEKKAQSDFLI